jgi:hypothetical protein
MPGRKKSRAQKNEFEALSCKVSRERLLSFKCKQLRKSLRDGLAANFDLIYGFCAVAAAALLHSNVSTSSAETNAGTNGPHCSAF